jgi:hypothetical protein
MTMRTTPRGLVETFSVVLLAALLTTAAFVIALVVGIAGWLYADLAIAEVAAVVAVVQMSRMLQARSWTA